jgi:DNA-binding NarL/FixJ family response regulator
VRVLLGEDNALLRDGLASLLRSAGHKVDPVANATDLLSSLLAAAHDIAVVDIRLPPGNADDGLRAVLTARSQGRRLPVMVLSQYAEPLYLQELLANGAHATGYLLKDRVSKTSEFLEALSNIARGGTVLDPELITRLVNRSAAQGRIDALTNRERDVLGLMAEGRSNAAIGRELYLSDSTIAKYTTNIFMKLGLFDNTDDNRRVLAVLHFLQN